MAAAVEPVNAFIPYRFTGRRTPADEEAAGIFHRLFDRTGPSGIRDDGPLPDEKERVFFRAGEAPPARSRIFLAGKVIDPAPGGEIDIPLVAFSKERRDKEAASPQKFIGNGPSRPVVLEFDHQSTQDRSPSSAAFSASLSK